MKSNVKRGKPVYLTVIGVAILLLVLGIEFVTAKGAPIDWLIRTTALAGYFAVLAAILSSAYMRQMVQFFGRSFIKVHHLASLIGLAMVTIHPLGVAWKQLSWRVFIPDVSSVEQFLRFGGRPAWYLLIVASWVAALRGAIGKRWKLLHYLNYLAFWLATAHGILIGTNLKSITMRIVFIALAFIVLLVMIHKRFLSPRPKKR